jgi:hypothetical protein
MLGGQGRESNTAPDDPVGKPAKSASGKARTGTRAPASDGAGSIGPGRWRRLGEAGCSVPCIPRSHARLRGRIPKGAPVPTLRHAHLVRIHHTAWRRFSSGFRQGTNGT